MFQLPEDTKYGFLGRKKKTQTGKKNLLFSPDSSIVHHNLSNI